MFIKFYKLECEVTETDYIEQIVTKFASAQNGNQSTPELYLNKS